MQYLGGRNVYGHVDTAMGAGWMKAGEGRRLSRDIERERPRLRSFLRRRIDNDADVEDILQDVFFELFEAYRLMQPIENVGAWLFRVARNRTVDFFRRKRRGPFAEPPREPEGEDDRLRIEELLPSPEAGPEAAYLYSVLVDEFNAALAALPAAQRDVFVAHELEGRSFRDLAAETGLGVNTLLSRKHYAVRSLRDRLQSIHDEFDDL